MKPGRLHYFFAREWPEGLTCLVVFTLLVPWFVAGMHIHPAEWGNRTNVVWILIQIPIVLTLAVFAAVFIALCVWVPIHERRASINGAPFRCGDRDRILVGKYRDRVVLVRGPGLGKTLSLELGETNKEPNRFWYFPHQLWRENEPAETNPAAPSVPESPPAASVSYEGDRAASAKVDESR
jgi:hypothetical protein